VPEQNLGWSVRMPHPALRHLVARYIGEPRSPDTAAPAREVDWAWRRMIGAGGRVRVTSLAEEVGWSRRHFGERFREVGLSPKQAARVLRFERAGMALRRDGRVDLAEVAAVAIATRHIGPARVAGTGRLLAGHLDR
jgi:AraC-like DNA-binding protein